MNKVVFLITSLVLTFGQVFAQSVYKEEFPGGVYIYDGDEPYENVTDIPFPKSGRSTDLIINTLENGLFDKWDQKTAKALTYCVSDKFEKVKERVVETFEEAAADWMRIANVKFVYMPQHDADCDQDNKNVVFDVRPVMRQPYLARAFFPNTKRVSRNILIDSSSYKYDDVALTGFLRHELGHTLGFRHEHISKDSKGLCTEDNMFQPVTAYDPTSVMHYPQCGGKNVITNLTISKLDEEGARSVYPF